MTVDAKRKAAAMAAIVDHLKRIGAQDWALVRDVFPDIAPATFWRMVAVAKKQLLASNIKPADPADGAVANGFNATTARLPQMPNLRTVYGQAAIDPQDILGACLAHAVELIGHARAPDGRLRSAKLLLAASKHMADVLRVAATVSSVLSDERRVRAFYRAILDELAAESPEFAARIVARLERLNAEAGLVSVVGS